VVVVVVLVVVVTVMGKAMLPTPLLVVPALPMARGFCRPPLSHRLQPASLRRRQRRHGTTPRARLHSRHALRPVSTVSEVEVVAVAVEQEQEQEQASRLYPRLPSLLRHSRRTRR
jgi:hypothetical protein